MSVLQLDPSRFAPADHSVQFYENDEYLCGLVAAFIAEGLRANEPAVVIATPEHRESFAAHLRAMGIDVETSPITMLDARDTLNQFINGAMPDRERFQTTVGGVLDKICEGDARKHIRAYGEMVALLWKDDNPEGAVRLEELWNELSGLFAFSLLCAYPIGNCYQESQSLMFEEVCRAHGRVVPSETFGPITDDVHAREIARLQQRAGALEAEIERRKELERALRE